MSLNNDVDIKFVDERTMPMTTGVRLSQGGIGILAGNRLLIDILRTLAHEWVHEYQYQKLGLKSTDKVKDIGGPEENMANTLAGIFIKKFEKSHPEFTDQLYNE